MMSLDEKNMDRAVQDRVIVLFRADWCPFCRRFKPIFDSCEGKTKIKLAEAVINEDENPLWDKYDIKVVPTIIAFSYGKIKARRDGKPGVGLIAEDIESLLKEMR